MKKITAKVITISSQLLVVSLFLLLMFYSEGNNDRLLTIGNNNFEKMADRTSFLFEKEELMTLQFDDNALVVLEDNTIEDSLSVSEKEVCEEESNALDMAIGGSLDTQEKQVIETYTGILTGYGPDCDGCGNYDTGKVVTASGYHISNIVNGIIEPAFTITYNDSEYGEVRIVAADDDIPFYSVVRITIPGGEPIIAIVLDRGSTVGFDNCRSANGCLTNFDLLYPTEAESLGKTQNVKFELLRSGK